MIWLALVGLFRSRASLLAEILVLRHQLNIQRRRLPKRHAFRATDRLIFAALYRFVPTVINALAIVRPKTVIKWHRNGFKSYWRWKSRRCGGRPVVPLEVRRLIREMSIANSLWGAPRIHGELLKLGIDVGQTSVAKYMVRRRSPPSQGWNTFLHNHADGIAAMDLFVVPTLSFRLLYGLPQGAPAADFPAWRSDIRYSARRCSYPLASRFWSPYVESRRHFAHSAMMTKGVLGQQLPPPPYVLSNGATARGRASERNKNSAASWSGPNLHFSESFQPHRTCL